MSKRKLSINELRQGQIRIAAEIEAVEREEKYEVVSKNGGQKNDKNL